MKLWDEFKNQLLRDGRLRKGSKILIACSGGPDSVLLLHLLDQLKTEMKWTLGIAYINHGLRPGPSKREGRFIRQLGGKYKIRVYIQKVPVRQTARKMKWSVEEAARHERYQALTRLARRYGYQKVVLAHNQNDQAETVLMRVIQGTGSGGLAGIRPAWKQDGILFCRPLLDFPKREILKELKKNGLVYRVDRSNSNPRFLRNRIRHELMPLLEKKYNPRTVEAVSRIPLILQDENEVMEKLVPPGWKRSVKSAGKGRLSFKLDRFRELNAAIQFKILNRALKKISPLSGLSFEAWKILRHKIARGSGYCHSLPKDIDLKIAGDSLLLYLKKK